MPAMSRSIVVLPHPDGPTRTPTSPRTRVKATSRSTSSELPDAARYILRTIRTSSSAESPAGCASFNGLHHQGFDRQYDDNKGQRIGEDAGHVEQLERNADFKA